MKHWLAILLILGLSACSSVENMAITAFSGDVMRTLYTPEQTGQYVPAEWKAFVEWQRQGMKEASP